MDGRHYLEDAMQQLKKLRTLADRAIAQIPGEALFAALDPESNSIALLMKHMAGNMRSRWTDFLTTDGEKPNRNRDGEFEIAAGEDRAAIEAQWEAGWSRTLATIGSLTDGDLHRTITVRGEPHTVLQAINRQLTHYASHVGQIIMLAKHLAGPSWQTLSIPRGKSKEYDVSKTGEPYLADQPPSQ